MDLDTPEGQRVSYRSCACRQCNNTLYVGDCEDDAPYGGACELPDRLRDHSEKVYQLKEVSNEQRVTLLIGPNEVNKQCHKAVLGFFSELFYGSFYGPSKEIHAGIVKLAGVSVECMNTFIHWAETGQIYSSLSLYLLLALAKQLQSNAFYNAVMQHIFGIHHEDPLEAKEAAAAYETSLPGAKIRAYIKQLILTEGPLKTYQKYGKDENGQDEPFYADWKQLIREGGELVDDIILVEKRTFEEGNAPNYWKKPCFWKHHDQYLEVVEERSIEEFAE